MALRLRVPATFFFIALLCLALPPRRCTPRLPAPPRFWPTITTSPPPSTLSFNPFPRVAKSTSKPLKLRQRPVELHPNLIVQEVEGCRGKPVRSSVTTATASSLSSNSPRQSPPTVIFTLTFTYSGLLFNEETAPSPCLRRVDSTRGRLPSAFPSRCSRFTNFPSNRYTQLSASTFQTFSPSPKPASPLPDAHAGKNSVEGNRLLYTFECKASPPMAPT